MAASLHSASRQNSQQTGRYNADILQAQVLGPVDAAACRRRNRFGDDAAILIQKLIGQNALSDQELQRVLMIIHAAFEQRNHLRPALRDPVATTTFLQTLTSATDRDDSKRLIADTIHYVQTSR